MYLLFIRFIILEDQLGYLTNLCQLSYHQKFNLNSNFTFYNIISKARNINSMLTLFVRVQVLTLLS